MYISKTTAERMAKQAVKAQGASGYKIKVARKSNPDRTLSIGYTFKLYWK